MGLLLLALTATAPALAQDNAAPPGAQQSLRDLLDTGAPPVTDIDAALGAGGLAALKRVYVARQGRPIWLSAAGDPLPSAKILIDRAAAIDGVLSPELRTLTRAAAARTAAGGPQGLAGLDLLLSGVYGALALDPRDPTVATGVEPALTAIAASADPGALLKQTVPADPGVWRLRDAIIVYRKLAGAGGWHAILAGPKLQLGDTGPRVAAIKHRLALTGDLAGAAETGDSFDPALDQAVRHFQARHGLAVDGVVGQGTLDAMNLPADRRLATLVLNLERRRRQDRAWGPHYIEVNVAAALYRLVESGRTIIEHPAVVGRPSWPTPLLESVIDKVEFHPYWRIPMRIADEEVWPKQDADPNYFSSQGIHVTGDQLVQDPGPNNPLGSVKFLFDNPYSVYLHDTAAPSLFAQADRFASHGCIRVADADDLAKALLAPDPTWPAARVDQALKGGGNRTVALREPVPLHIVYDTAWVDDDGTVEFRNDVYGRDRVIQAPPTAPNPAPPTVGPMADGGAAGAPSGTCDG